MKMILVIITDRGESIVKKGIYAIMKWEANWHQHDPLHINLKQIHSYLKSYMNWKINDSPTSPNVSKYILFNSPESS